MVAFRSEIDLTCNLYTHGYKYAHCAAIRVSVRSSSLCWAPSNSMVTLWMKVVVTRRSKPHWRREADPFLCRLLLQVVRALFIPIFCFDLTPDHTTTDRAPPSAGRAVAGDTIIVTSSDLYFDHTESFVVSEVVTSTGPNTWLELATAAQYRHFGPADAYTSPTTGATVPVVAEVALVESGDSGSGSERQLNIIIEGVEEEVEGVHDGSLSEVFINFNI